MKRILCAGMFAVLLIFLTVPGCSKKQDDASRVTAYYSGLSAMTVQAALTTQYSDYSVDFEIVFQYDAAGDSRIRVMKPEEIADIAVKFDHDKTTLEYDGISLEVGLPEDTPVNPAAALPDLLKAWSGGIVYEQGREKVDGTDCLMITYKSNRDETEILYRTWFDADTLKPVRAEIYQDGERKIQCEYLLAENFK